MELETYLNKYSSRMKYLETKFLRDVFYEDLGEKGLDYITPEVNIPRNDGTDKQWRIDFIVQTTAYKYAIECNGFSYHAAGMVSKERFDELQNKSNEIVRQGYIFINLSRDQIENNVQDAIYQLRRTFIGDTELYSIFLKRNKGRITPHGIQEQALEKLNESRDIGFSKGLIVLATGLGKTYLGVFDTLQVKAESVLYIVHVGEVLKKARNSFEKLLPDRINDMGMYQSNSKEIDKKILFATIQTLTKSDNLEQFTPDQFDYIILDETHHLAAPTYKKVFNFFKPKYFLGLTATPERLDEQDILPFYENNLVYRMDQIEAVKQGFLTNLEYFGFKDNVDYSGIRFNGFKYDVNDLNKLLLIKKRDEAIIEKYLEKAAGRKAIGFCVSTEHADWCAKVFNEHGIPAVAIHSRLDGNESQFNLGNVRSRIADFENNKYKIAFVVNMFNEGIDFPEVDCILLLRPTESITILTQQIGRGLRVSPGKRNVVILDFIGNYQTAYKILPALGIHNASELKFDKEKQIYYYDNDGRRVEFAQEVVEIFRLMLSKSTKEVNEKLLNEEWLEYGRFLKDTTKSGAKLYWKVGNKNDHIETHIWAIEEIDKYMKSMNGEEMSLHIRNESKKTFPGKTLEGTRGLFLSKLLGLLTNTTPLEPTMVFEMLRGKTLENQNNIITQQLEKLFFWNDIYSLTDRHTSKENRTPIDQYFKIYPLFFLYKILMVLHDDYGYKDYSCTKFEFDYFISLARTYDDVNSIAERIIKYREETEKYEIEKYLKKMSNMDARFYKVLRYSKYFNFSTFQLAIRDTSIELIRERVGKFEDLYNSGKLILFESSNPDIYRRMLYSSKDIFDYHNTL